MIDLLSIHVGILILTGVIILYSDHQAFLYIRGKKLLLHSKSTDVLHYLVWAGLIGMITTGVLMALPAWQYYISMPGFLLKMVFVGILVGNSFVITSLKSVAYTTPFASLSGSQKMKLFMSGAASAVSWVGAAVTALIVLG